MRIDPFSVRLARPLSTAHGEIANRDGFLITVTPDEDDVDEPGLGEATPLPGWTEPIDACEASLRAAGDSSASASPAAGSSAESSGPPRAGSSAAAHGIELARADAAARAADRSLARFLADRYDLPDPDESVPVNATVGDASVEETVADAETAVGKGYDCLKVKVGVRDPGADAARLRAVRSAVGDDVAIRVDANGAWEYATAERALREFAPLELDYVEQPLPADDLEGLAALRGSRPDVPIAVDESLATYSPERVLEAGAADVLVLKPMVLGGPEATMGTAIGARRRGADVVVTTTIDAVVARTAALHVAAAAPTDRACGLATGRLLESDLAPDPAPVRNGGMEVPDGPGLAGSAFDDLSSDR